MAERRTRRSFTREFKAQAVKRKRRDEALLPCLHEA